MRTTPRPGRSPASFNFAAPCYPAYVATETDKRVYVYDCGNQRIVSIKLGYRATERVPLK